MYMTDLRCLDAPRVHSKRRRLQVPDALFDALYIVVTVIFFAALIGYMVVCDRMAGGT